MMDLMQDNNVFKSKIYVCSKTKMQETHVAATFFKI